MTVHYHNRQLEHGEVCRIARGGLIFTYGGGAGPYFNWGEGDLGSLGGGTLLAVIKAGDFLRIDSGLECRIYGVRFLAHEEFGSFFIHSDYIIELSALEQLARAT